MSLPRYLEKKFLAYLSNMGQEERFLAALCAGADYGELVFEVLNTKRYEKAAPSFGQIVSSFIRARWSFFEIRRYRGEVNDQMERIPAKLYVGLESLITGVNLPESRTVAVPKYFEERLLRANSEREAKDRSEAELAKKISALRNKVYASRCFPAHLRLIIFERDKYCCQICLRTKARLCELGLSLEVDHILAYIDGGKTTYSNGLTLCSECNSAKHHAKRYLNAVSPMEKTSSKKHFD